MSIKQLTTQTLPAAIGIGPLLVILAGLLWGTTGTSQTFAPPEAVPTSVGAVRMAVGGITLFLFAALRGQFKTNRHWPFWPTVLSAFGMAGYQIFFFNAVARTGVAIGTTVAIGSAPILAGAMGFFAARERPTLTWGITTFMAAVGASLLLSAGKEINLDPLGVLLAAIAGTCYALYTVASKILLKTQTPDSATAMSASLGAIFLLPFMLTADLSWLAQPRGMAVALHLGIIATGLSYYLFSRGLQLIPIATASTLALTEPLTAGLLGIFVLGETLTPLALAGLSLLFCGIAILSLQKHPGKSIRK